MPTRTLHEQLPNSIYFITFTFFNWLPLFQITNAYETVYKWFDNLYEKGQVINGYVIMPNHVHVLLYFPTMPKTLNVVIGNAKRFIAYEIIKRLEVASEIDLLVLLKEGVNRRQLKKGQVHKVFEESFDAKECYSKEFIYQKLNYIHHNPVRGKWQLVQDFAEYEHSSASFYELGVKKYDKIVHINEIIS